MAVLTQREVDHGVKAVRVTLVRVCTQFVIVFHKNYFFVLDQQLNWNKFQMRHNANEYP